MSARPAQSPDSRRPTSAGDFASDLARTSEHSRPQTQVQPRSILRQPQPNHPLSDTRGVSPEFDQSHFRRQAAQLSLPESRSRTSSRHDRPSSMQLPTPRLFLVDAEKDSVARACGKTPSPALRYPPESYRTSGPRRGSDDPVHKKPQAPRARVENPRELYGALHRLLVSCDSTQDRQRLRVWDYLDWQDILAVQGWDYKDWEERDQERRRFAQMRKNPHAEVNSKMVVLTAPLRDVILYASTTTSMGGITYDVPIIVHSCVEALLRTSIYKPRLFMDFPNRRHCDELIDDFNYGPSYGEGINLNQESTENVCFLLSTFLSALPEPLIHPSLFEPFFVWCVQPSCKRDDTKRKIEATIEEEARIAAHRRGEQVKRSDVTSRTIPVTWTKEEKRNNEELEKPQIAIAVVLLKALPAAHFALLIYLLRFFTQLPICPENGMSLEECAKKFSEKLMGNTRIKSHQVMLWFLTRWPQISDGLFSESRAAYEEMKQESKRNAAIAAAANAPQPPVDIQNLSLRKEPRGDRRALLRSTTIGSMYDSSPMDTSAFVRSETSNGRYRSTTIGSAIAYDPRRLSAVSTEASTQIEQKDCPVFPQTPVIQSNNDAGYFGSDKISFVSESASIGVYSNPDLEPSREPASSPRQQLGSDDDKEITAGRAQIAAQMTRINEGMQTIAERDETITRLKREKAEQFCALLDETKRKEDAEKERDEYRQVLVNMKMMLGTVAFPTPVEKTTKVSETVAG